MNKPYRLDEYDVILSDEEKYYLDALWPFQGTTNPGEKQLDLTFISAEVLDYFGISDQKTFTRPNTVSMLLRELRSVHCIEALPLTGKNLSLTGDNGLLLVGYKDGLRLVKPQWFGGYEKVDHNYIYAAILIRCLPSEGTGVLRVLSRVLHGRWNQIVVVAGIALLAVLIGLIPTWLQEYIFNVVVPDGSRFLMVQIGVLMLCLRLSQRAFSLFNSLVGTRLELNLGYYLSALLMHKLLYLDPSFYKQHGIGDIQQRVNSAHAFRRAVQNSFVAVITAVITVVCNLILVYFKTSSIQLCLICFALTLLVPIVDTLSSIIESILRLKRLEVASIVEDSILKPMESLKTLRGLAIEDYYFKEYAVSRRKLARIDIWIGINQSISRVVTLIIGSTIIGLLLYWFGTPSSLSGLGVKSADNLSQGFIILLLSAFTTVNGAVQSFSRSVLMLVKTVPDAIRFKPIVEAQSSALAKINSFNPKINSVAFADLFIGKKMFENKVSGDTIVLEKSETVFLYSKSMNESEMMFNEICELVFERKSKNYHSSITINNSNEGNSTQMEKYRQCFIAIEHTSAWISGTLLEALTGQSTIDDHKWFQECMDAVGLSFTQDQLIARYDINTTESVILSQPMICKIALARAFFLEYDFIIAHQLFDILGRDTLEKAMTHIQAHQIMMIVLTSKPELIASQSRVFKHD